MKLNIGSGNKIKKSYINLDIVKLKNVDVVWDLNKYPWPFKNDTFKEVFADNVLEHLDSIVKPLEEIYRISKKKAKIKIIVPFSPSVWSFADPTHKQFYTYFTFNYFRTNDALNYYSPARFVILKRKIIFNKYFKLFELFINSISLFKKIYVIFLYFLIPANFLEVELEVIK